MTHPMPASGPDKRGEPIALWRCPVHGWIQADLFDPDDEGIADECPVPRYVLSEEPCGETLQSADSELFIPLAAHHAAIEGVTQQLEDCAGKWSAEMRQRIEQRGRVSRALELIAVANDYINASRGPDPHELDDPSEGYRYVKCVLDDVKAALLPDHKADGDG